MSSLRQLKSRIQSIDKIVKITQAMEVVSLFRLKKAEKQVYHAMDFFKTIQKMMSAVASSINFVPHPFFLPVKREKPLVVCIGSDKGLCGGFNYFIGEKVKKMQQELSPSFFIYGKRLTALRNIVGRKSIEIFDEVSQVDVEKLSQLIVERLSDNVYDSLYLVYNQFRSSLAGKAHVLPVLPVEVSERQDRDYYFEGQNLWPQIFMLYIREALNAAIIESKAAEEFTRVFTMRQAKENATDLKSKLYLQFHKMRQGMITRELAEISAMLQ